ncbi:alpha/beta fold hydrolase [Rhizobium leguminosarum]|uniref:alpha/beta fold hydrolase n=1 Tax=Rhizobium leguminosarum TaxID=384 RepID=UPI000FEC43CD|nr:alpha/beta hydrolase [Rhizobium leguminosarum]MBY2989070.1 alpha/beta hydrolase [Rhizobium leguminosarum]RWX22969.1 alpha/beta hydrolase [Rhizobium leguminosarum]
MKPRQPHAPLRGFDRVVNGRNVHLLNVGDDAYPPVVLLHGCGSLAQEVLAPFRKTGLHIVAPDRPGYGLSDPLPQRLRGPLAQSLWLEDFVDALGFSSLTIAGHSIGCAPAILLARRRPDLVKSLVLIAPFCRPTPEQAMLLLRLAIAPWIGGMFSQHLLYRFADYFGERVMRKAHHPNPVPDTLADFPYRHAASPQSLRMMADELLQFNADMAAVGDEPIPCVTHIIYGMEDAVLDPHWHLDWLVHRVPQARIRLLQGVGHNPHHAASAVVRSALQDAVWAGAIPGRCERPPVAEGLVRTS